MPRRLHTVSAAERRRIAAALERAVGAGERAAVRIVREQYERLRHLPPHEAMRVIRESMDEVAKRLAAEVGASFSEAAVIGARVSARSLGLGRGWTQAATRLTQHYERTGGIQLSPRLYERTRAIYQGAERAIAGAVARGEGAMRLAYRLRDEVHATPGIAPTRLLEQLHKEARAAAASAGSPHALKQWAQTQERLERYAGQLKRHGYGIGAPTEQALDEILAAVKRGNAQAVDEAVRWWTYHKQSYHQRAIARTEMGRAYSEGFKANADVPHVVGFKWNLEGGERRADICDVYAGQDLYGLGDGCYPFDKVPDCPAHTNCNCFLTEVIDESVGVDEQRPPAPPQRAGETEAWLRGQPAETQREILGASGYEAFRRSRGRELPGRLRV